MEEPALLLREFVNTLDVETGADRLTATACCAGPPVGVPGHLQEPVLHLVLPAGVRQPHQNACLPGESTPHGACSAYAAKWVG